MKIGEIAQNRVLPSLQKIMSQKLKETDKSGELKLTLCDLAALRAYKDVRDVVEKEGLADIRRQYG